MTRTRRFIIATLAVIVMAFVAELVREAVVYYRMSSRLESANRLIKPGMTKQQVIELANTPDSIQKRELETWYWSASNHQGKLWELLGLTWVKGHESLGVEFNSQEEVNRIWGGIN